MPCPGSTVNGHESPPSCTTRQHAGCLLQNQESPVVIYHRQQDCYTPSWGSKESTTIYFGWQPQEIFRPLPLCLGMCPAWRGKHVPFLHPKTSPLVRRFLEDVSLRHKSHPRQAPRCSSLGFCQRYGTYTHPSGQRCLFNSNYEQFEHPKWCHQRRPNGSLHWQNDLTENNSTWTSMTTFSLHL